MSRNKIKKKDVSISYSLHRVNRNIRISRYVLMSLLSFIIISSAFIR